LRLPIGYETDKTATKGGARVKPSNVALVGAACLIAGIAIGTRLATHDPGRGRAPTAALLPTPGFFTSGEIGGGSGRLAPAWVPPPPVILDPMPGLLPAGPADPARDAAQSLRRIEENLRRMEERQAIRDLLR